MTSDNDLLTQEQVSELLGFAPSTLQTWRSRGGGPPFLRLGHRTVRYRRSAVDAWVLERDAAMRARGELGDD